LRLVAKRRFAAPLGKRSLAAAPDDWAGVGPMSIVG
jgi:hypothetical protein